MAGTAPARSRCDSISEVDSRVKAGSVGRKSGQIQHLLTLITEFAAISLALSHLGVSPRVAVPLAAAGLITLVVTGSYVRWERTVIILCLMDVLWFVLASHTHPPLLDVARNTIVPHLPPGWVASDLVFLTIAIVGTTIAPWHLSFQQSTKNSETPARSLHIPRSRRKDERCGGSSEACLTLPRLEHPHLRQNGCATSH